tara:strand:+ start:914 stop:1786 length:873 start_codon:yes stop_codon:yes gene_type:complete
MGLLDGTTQQSYYQGSSFGDYQFVSLDSIISAFMVVYVGENKIINKVSRTDVQFHGMRAIQELSYDVFKSFKSQEIEVPNTLKMMLPQDYVNYTKITKSDSSGIERILYPTGKTSNPFAITQVDGVYQFTGGNELQAQTDSDTWTNFQTIQSNNQDYAYDDIDPLRSDNRGRRYGLDPQHAQDNGTFFIDQRTGYIHFGSDLAGKTIILHYVSDGLGTDGEMVVHKFCEEAVYKHIMYGLVSSRSNMPQYIVQRFKQERFAETRKAKIRLSNIKMEEFTQILKGLSKPIK